MNIEIWHNILWSRYKGIIFGELYKAALQKNHTMRVFHISVTDSMRAGLGEVDLADHQYPFEIIFPNNQKNPSLISKIKVLKNHAFSTKADVIILAGYHRPEYLIQAAILRLRGKTFCGFLRFYDKGQNAIDWQT